ncbi:MAG TPA: hypothetical protein VIG34_03960 [Xanthobacteraceae bacterium]
MRKSITRNLCVVVAAGFAATLWTAQAEAQGRRTKINGVEKTPLSMCARGSIQYVRHTRRALKFPGLEYCNDREWNVSGVEEDATHVYWYVPFGSGSEPQYGAGNVYCRCRHP